MKLESGFVYVDDTTFVVLGGKVGIGSAELSLRDDGIVDYETVFIQPLSEEYGVGEDIMGKEDATGEQIIFCFNSASQVDVLIGQLKEVKAKLQKRDKETSTFSEK